MTFTIHEKGKRPRAWCVECGKPHPAKDCPHLEWRIVKSFQSGAGCMGSCERWYRQIAANLGIPWRRVQNTAGRMLREERSRLG